MYCMKVTSKWIGRAEIERNLQSPENESEKRMRGSKMSPERERERRQKDKAN